MNNELVKIISGMDGIVLAIGVNDLLVESLEKNEKIINCDVLNHVTSKEQLHEEKAKKQKTINIKKLRKIYKKKKVDYIICEYDQMNKYLKTFIKDSVYINKTKLYFYGKVNTDSLKKYERYNCKIEIKKFNKNYIVEIDNSNSKTNVLKDFVYKLVDGFTSLIEIIGDILMG